MKYLFSILFLGILLASCGSNSSNDIVPVPVPAVDPVQQLAEDKTLIKDYLTTNNLTAEESPSGLHYIIEESGNGEAVTENSIVNVLIKGYFLDGTTFVPSQPCSPSTIALGGNLIPGFKEGLQLFNLGGKGTLLLPSALGFGQNGSGTVQPNTVIALDIEIIVDQQAFDRAKIQDFLTANNIVADSTLSGIHYVITEQGSGESPTGTSTVTVNYKGYFADGTIFDESNPTATFPLNNVIAGWQEVLPLLKKEGSGTFLIPSNLAYGNSGNNSIPGNTMLIFDITLLDFNN